MKQKPGATRITIIIAILILAVVAYYAYLSNRSKVSRQQESMTAIEEVLSRNLKNDYPPTPKEVMKYYNDITKCLYNEECSNDDVDKLGMKIRELYDPDLQAANEIGSYLVNLENEVKARKESKTKLLSSTVAASTNVDYYTRNGYSFARLLCTYNVSDNGKKYTMRMIYLLRKDSDKRWKIYGWDFEENVDLNGDGVKGD